MITPTLPFIPYVPASMIAIEEIPALLPTLPATFDPSNMIYFFDMIGIIACSVSGTILAKHKNFDVFGCLLVSMVTAIGGGTVRDVILDRHPLFWMVDMNYLTLITITSLVFQIFFHPNSRRVDNLLKFFDSIGLSAFTLIGIKVATAFGANIAVSLLLGVITIIVGGIIRDMICNEIPLVLQHEIYITAALLGGSLYFILPHFGIAIWLTEILTMLTIFVIRTLAIRYDWRFPDIELYTK